MSTTSAAPKQPIEREHKPWINGVSGGVGACAAKTLLSPIQRIVVLKQLGNHKGMSTPQLIKVIVAEEGSIKGFWRGNLTSIIQRFPYSGLQLMAYDRCKFLVAGMGAKFIGDDSFVGEGQKKGLKQHLLGVATKAFSGGLAAAVSGSAVFPIEVVRTRLMSGDERYRKIVPTVKHIWRETNSPRNFYRGLGASLIQRIPDILINFVVFESVKFEMEARGYSMPMCIVAGGSLAALTAVAFTFPLDICKRRIAMAGQNKSGVQYTSTPQALMHILRNEGVRGLYAGATLEAGRCVPQVVLMWFAIDYCRLFLETYF